MADSGMPPPLEDMTATLDHARKIRDKRLPSTQTTKIAQTKISSTMPTDQGIQQPVTTGVKTEETQDSKSAECRLSENNHNSELKSKTLSAKGQSDFGGLKKGFLFGASKSCNSSAQGKKESQRKETGIDRSDGDAIPFIRPKTQNRDDSLRMDEVQAALDSTKSFLQEKDWLTGELLEKVEKSETLSRHLGDPRFMQAVTEFQTNPKAATARYANDQEIQMFLKEFCGILGEHFMSLDEEKGMLSHAQNTRDPTLKKSGGKIVEVNDEANVSLSPKPTDTSLPADPQVQKILADPTNHKILMDPQVQKLIHNLRNNPEKAQRMLFDGDREFRKKVDHLISLGLLKFKA